MSTIGPGIWKKNENHGKLETHTVEREIWQEPLENVKNEKYTFQTLDFCEKKLENKTQTLYDLEYGKKLGKTWKMRNAYCRT